MSCIGSFAAAPAAKFAVIFGAFGSRKVADQFASEGFEYLYQVSSGQAGPAIAVCKGNTALRDMLATVLGTMLADGTPNTISARWF